VGVAFGDASKVDVAAKEAPLVVSEARMAVTVVKVVSRKKKTKPGLVFIVHPPADVVLLG
jgi:hypothetical protein